jgi:hypothetical protein
LLPYEEAIKIQQFRETIDMHCQSIITNPLEDDS